MRDQVKKQDFLTFSKRVKKLNTELRITLKELSKILGVSAPHLSAWMNGKSPLTSNAWKKLEDAERSTAIDREQLGTVDEDVAQYYPETEECRPSVADLAERWINAQSDALGLALKKLKGFPLSEAEELELDASLTESMDNRGRRATAEAVALIKRTLKDKKRSEKNREV